MKTFLKAVYNYIQEYQTNRAARYVKMGGWE
jgi:hypothetical protein